MTLHRSSRLGLAAALALAACGSDNKDFTLSSPQIAAGGTIQADQVFNGLGCTGQNSSPELHWDNPPAGTQSFVVTMFDRDAPTGSGFWHWTVLNIPASARSLPKGAGGGSGGSGTSGLPSGAIQGKTDFGAPGYGGPCPPDGDAAHHYTFTIYALKVASLTGVDASSTGAFVTFNAKSQALASASFEATYSRGTPGTTTHPDIPTAAGFTLTSGQVTEGGTIGNAQVFTGCGGTNQSPSLTWTDPPAGTGSFVLTMFDRDAPTGSGFWHWLVFDIPGTARTIDLGAGTAGAKPAGGTQAYTDFGQSAYGGPCPPAGDPPHHYTFTLYAIPSSKGTIASQGISESSTGGFLGFVTRSVATAKAELTATYGR